MTPFSDKMSVTHIDAVDRNNLLRTENSQHCLSSVSASLCACLGWKRRKAGSVILETERVSFSSRCNGTQFLHNPSSRQQPRCPVLCLLSVALKNADSIDACAAYNCSAAGVPEDADVWSDRLYDLLPRIHLTDLLMEVDSWTMIKKHFTHLYTKQPASDGTLVFSVILSDATNIGLTKIADAMPCVWPQTQKAMIAYSFFACGGNAQR